MLIADTPPGALPTRSHSEDPIIRQTTTLLTTLLGATLLAACGTDYGTAPTPLDPVSAEDHALEITGTSFVRQGNHQTLRATGDITQAVGQFRTLLGDLNPNTAGEQPGGRREINWDAVPAAVTNTDAFPADFFNATSPRGVLFSTTGTGFRVADDGFTSVNAAYAGEFNTFSPTKIFAAVGSTTMEVRFVVAGSGTPARVTGFGIVFGDVGHSRTSTIEYFDAAGVLLATVAVPRRVGGTGLAFAGITFDAALVARVRITAGEAPLGATALDADRSPTAAKDLVAMDDFIYGEPHPLP